MNKEPMIKLDGKNKSVYIYGIKITSVEDWVLVKEKITEVQTENTNLKQALIDIRKVLTECKMLSLHEFDWEEQIENILQIIDKVLGDDEK